MFKQKKKTRTKENKFQINQLITAHDDKNNKINVTNSNQNWCEDR